MRWKSGRSSRGGGTRGGGPGGKGLRWWARLLPLLSVLPLLPRLAGAQEFVPPQEQAGQSKAALRLGVFGFGSRVGIDFEGGDQAILSPTLDVADIFTDRVRLRPSVEVGVGDVATTYVVNLELVYRFTSDTVIAVPYVGFGGAVYSQEGCAAAVNCPRAWAQFALGFELKFREHINWLLEYHGEDGLRRHRFFIGLVTRRGP